MPFHVFIFIFILLGRLSPLSGLFIRPPPALLPPVKVPPALLPPVRITRTSKVKTL